MKNLLSIISFAIVALIVSATTVGVEFTPLVAAGIGVVSLGVPSIDAGVIMMAIPVQQARALFTKKLVAVYKEKVSPTSFLRSFFTQKESLSKEISIEVRRGTEKVAVDVERASNGNRNTFSKSTEKIFEPPFYYEYLTANDHRLYDVAIGMQSEIGFAQLTQELADDLMELQYKIERAYEKQCAEIFETGIVTLNAGTNIDFKRKAGSLVDKTAGNYWATGTIDPYADLAAGCAFIRNTGKTKSTVFNAIMGSTALTDFLGNAIVKARSDIRNFSMDQLGTPQANAVGGIFHGEVTAGSYRVRLWTYPEIYENANGDQLDFINSKKVVILPENPNFVLSYAAVPQLISDGNMVPQQGAYLVQEFFDDRKTAHEISIKSAGVAIPVAVDQIYTVQVVA